MVLDASSSLVIAISVGIIFLAMVSSFLAYLCGCCKKIPSRDELAGLSGIVKITNLDTEQNHGPVAISITRTPSEDNVNLSSIPSSNASAKRLNGVGSSVCNPGTATRSLPELPVGAAVSVTSNRNDKIPSNFISYNGTGDTNSDLYATLEEHQVGTSVLPESKLPHHGPLYSSTPTSSSAATYEQIDEDTTYNKLKGEHPYAQVVENDSGTSSTYGQEHSPLDRMNVSAVDEIDGIANIPAASAITGSVAASNELPYMTPPIHSDHFSGDSQDSTKGYTSITVREPLARIRPNQTTNQDASDSHYTVLSDDSDEMYAAIQEAYTSGSETYAQIQPLPSTNPTYRSVPETASEASSSQKFGATSVHSRQASTSSVASSLTNRNSPKEKRQANSPLPKPPDITADDMYAKVLKKRRNENDRCSSRDSVYLSDPDSASSHSFHVVGPSSSGELAALLKLEHREEKSDKGLDDDEEDPDRYACGYETLPERNYEMLADVNQSVGYETVKEDFRQNAGYESLPEPDSLTPGYESIRESTSGYEKIKYANKEDESDPNYEELKPQTTDEPFHCYATINKNSRRVSSSSEHVAEPDYASLTRHAADVEYDNGNKNDPFYERIQKRATNLPTGEDENRVELNDRNNNHSSPAPKAEQIPKDHSIAESNLNELYSKVNKNVKR